MDRKAPLCGLSRILPRVSAPFFSVLSRRPNSALPRPRCHLTLPSFRPFAPGQLARAPGARQSSIYCLVSTVTRRRRQCLPSTAPTRRRDVCPLLPFCPYLERRRGQGGVGSPDSRGAPPPARLRPRAGLRSPGLRTPPPTPTLRRRAGARVASILGQMEAAVKA